MKQPKKTKKNPQQQHTNNNNTHSLYMKATPDDGLWKVQKFSGQFWSIHSAIPTWSQDFFLNANNFLTQSIRLINGTLTKSLPKSWMVQMLNVNFDSWNIQIIFF